jgi:V8-like Glu-specific endopeptidase
VRVLSKAGQVESDFSDCAFIERTVGSGADQKTLRYVAVGLHSTSEGALKQLILELDKCILISNGLTAAQARHASKAGKGEFADAAEGEDEDITESDFSSATLEDVGVIGADDRVQVTPTTDAPWRWMCHLELLDSRGRSEGHGSGVLISDRHVLTAAHVVWDAAQDAHLHFIQVRPGLDADTEPFGSWSATRARVCPKFVPDNPNNQEWDYALVTLDKPVGTMTFKSIQSKLRYWGAADFGGKFTMGPGDPRVLVSTDVMTAGYRGNKAYGKAQWLAKGRIRSMSIARWPNSIFATADVTEGQSGSPMWVKEGDVFRLIGVVVDAGKSVNVARRVSRGMMTELRKWITEDPTGILRFPKQDTTKKKEDVKHLSAERFAEVLAQCDKFTRMTSNQFGSGTLTYEGTAVSDKLQQTIVLDELRAAGLTGPDQQVPAGVRVKHGVTNDGRRMHYYLNYSSVESNFKYSYGAGEDLLTGRAIANGEQVTLKPWDVAIVEETAAN